MSASDWLSRSTLGWLLAAQFALIAVHIEHLPAWLMAVWLVSAGWRILVFRGLTGFPPRWIKLLLVVASMAGIWSSYGDWRGLEPMAALLISGFCFKLVEAATRRDAYVVLFLGWFVALTAFLFDQGLASVAQLVMVAGLLLTTQVALHQGPRSGGFTWRAPRLAAILLLQALPLMALLFLVTPRLGPLWQVPVASGTARTGMSDEMSPGDIAELARSDALAFRARFVGALLPPGDLYWRGLVLDHFDGRSWRSGATGDWPLPEPDGKAAGNTPATGPVLDYEVYLEPTGERWLYSLGRSVSDHPLVIETLDWRLLALRPITDKFKYAARVWPRATFDEQLSSWQRQRLLALPAGYNERTRQWAAELRARHSDDRRLIAAVLDHFNRQPYVYTLRPPPLGRDSVDHFLFGTRAGFCEHYAGSFVFLLRAAGIPARVVVGYQGGEVNPLTSTVMVRQYDAHAWTEAWLPGSGWVRLDPTAAVAPERVESGLEQAVGNEEFLADTPLSPSRYRHLAWLNSVRFQMDALNYQWTRWVVNYRDDTQRQVLGKLLGEVNTSRLLLLVAGVGGITLAVVAIALMRTRQRARLSAEQRLYQRFCRAMARRGYPPAAGMAPRTYIRWLADRRPEWAFLDELGRAFEALQYRPLTPVQRRALQQRLRRCVRTAERAS